MGSPSAWDIITNSALQQGIIGHWKLNAQTGASSNIAQDVGPNGLHGLVEAFNRSTGNPIPLPTIVSGKIRSAYDFEAGVSSTEHQRVNLGSGALVTPDYLSLSVWVWLDPDGTHRADDYQSTIAANYDWDGGRDGFHMHYYPTGDAWRASFIVNGGATGVNVGGGMATTYDAWHHYVATWDGRYARVYADGVMQAETEEVGGGAIFYEAGVETWFAGFASSVTYASGQAGVMRGRLDEVTMWDRAITDGEVALLHNNGAGRFFDMKTAGWWDFNGTDAALRMDGKDAHVFDPADNTNDYTCLGVIEPDTWADVGKAYGIVMKWDNLAVIRQWSLYQTQNLGIVAASVTDGTTTSSVQSTTNVVIGDENFVGARYEYSGTPGTSSALDVYCRDNKESISNAAGPINNPTDVDIQLADGDNSAYDAFFDGKIYWLAYWNRKLTDQEVEDVRTGAIHPRRLNPDFYWDGHQAVAGTYVSEQPADPRYWEFTVEGTPVKGGSALETLPVPIGDIEPRPFPRDVYEGGSVIEKGLDNLVALGFRTAAQHDSPRVAGRVTVEVLPDSESRPFAVGFRTAGQHSDPRIVGRASIVKPDLPTIAVVNRTARQKASALRRGLAALLRFSRKRGR